MAFSRSAKLVSRLIGSKLSNPQAITTRSFRPTVSAAAHSTDSTGDDPPPEDSHQKEETGEEFEAFNQKAMEMVNDLKARLKEIYPQIEILDIGDRDDVDKLNNRAFQLLAEVRKKIKASHPEISERFSEMLYWHPFQEEGNGRPFELKVDEENWSVRIDMPGIGSKGVRVWFESNNLHFKGEEKDKGDGARRYSSKFYIPPGQFQTNKISAVLNNGVLNIVIPRIKAPKNENFIAVEVKE